MHSRDARCTSDERLVRQRRGFLIRKGRRLILVALAIAALTLPSVGDAFAQVGMGGFGGGGGFGRGGGMGGGFGGRGMSPGMPRGGPGGAGVIGPGKAMQVRPGITRVPTNNRTGRVPTVKRTTRVATPSDDGGTTRPPKRCRSRDCKPPKNTGRKPPRDADRRIDVVSKPSKQRAPILVESVPGTRIIQRVSRQRQSSGGSSSRFVQGPYRRAPGGMPPSGEARFVPDQVLCVLQASLSQPEIERFLEENRLARTPNGAQRIGLLDAQVFRFRITDGRPVRTVIAALERDVRVLGVQANYWFTLVQDTAPIALEASATVPGSAPDVEPFVDSRSGGSPSTSAPADAAPEGVPTLKAAANAPAYAAASEPTHGTVASDTASKEANAAADPVAPAPTALMPAMPEPAAATMLSLQYAIAKLQVQQAQRVSRGERVLVAVIDSRIDAAHPELEGTIVKQIDVLDDTDAAPHSHGTAMAGAIVAKSRLTGVAPGARVVAVRAFSNTSNGGASGTSFDLARAVDRAVEEGARIVNLSFAGPQDPMLQQSLKAARQKGVVLVAAAGNAGPKSAPLYPAADPSVIAVTATDSDDHVYKGANRGKYIAVAAPGVDVLVAAPEQKYELSTGTSVAAAHVSGVAALLLSHNPSLNPDRVRRILTDSARSIGPKAQEEYGAGLTDAYKAILTLNPSGADRGPAATAAPPVE